MMRYKTLEDVERVIAKSKPEAVINTFIRNYLEGEHFRAAYEADFPAFDTEGNPLAYEDKPLFEQWLEEQPPYEPDIAAWRLENYALLRRAAYGTWQKQLEMQADGTWHEHVAFVKQKFPKQP